MRGVSKKMFISILTSVIVMVTMVATTFAWVGIFTYANTEKFSLNLKVNELNSNYYLTISNSGEKNTFSDNVSSIDIKRQIVNNMYSNKYSETNDTTIESIFNNIILNPASTDISNNRFSQFEKINFYASSLDFIDASKDYFKFDLYFSVDTKEGISSETTGIKTNIFLTELEKMLTGTVATDTFSNSNPFGKLPSSQTNDLLKSIPNTFSVNSKNACRIGFELYEPISINDSYLGNEVPVKSMIYQGGNELPSYDSKNDVYDLGSCLPEDQNTALQELKVIRPGYSTISSVLYNDKLNSAMNRGDLIINESNSNLWDKNSSYNYLGVMNGIQTKMKITVYFWFEGWDSDCLRFIVDKPVSVSLTFTSGTDDIQ